MIKLSKSNNLAYDYSVYEPVRKAEPVRKIQVKKAAHKQTISAFKAFITAVAATFLLCAIIYAKAEESRLYKEASRLENQLAVISSDNVIMQSELEAKTNIKYVEEYAENVLGLQKLDKAQIEYIELQKENVIRVTQAEDENFFVSIKNWFNGALEYIGA